MDIALLLAALVHERQKEPYLLAQLPWTMIHHDSQVVPIRALMVPVVEPAFEALLMPPSCRTKAFAARLLAASLRAVPIATVTVAAQEEHLTARGGTTDHEAK